MDLKEAISYDNGKRHPWETARLAALQDLLKPNLFDGMSILDLGCGDGFVAAGLFKGINAPKITAVDTNLTDEMIAKLSEANSGITFQKEISNGGPFHLVLLFDVLEHVKDEESFLREIVTRYLMAKGMILITVPAFKFLYSGHDTFLGHYRRYSLHELKQRATTCGLDVRRSGYLFSSLLLPKLVLYKLLKTSSYSEWGGWRKGNWLIYLIEQFLKLDNKVLIAIGRLGITIPGLTGWVLCEKRG